MTEYKRIKALFPKVTPTAKWIPLQNGFEGMYTTRGAMNLRRKVKTPHGGFLYELYRVTPKGGMKFVSYGDV